MKAFLRVAPPVLVVLITLVVAASADASIAKVQSGTVISQTSGTSITPTLALTSTAGHLLTAVVATTSNVTVTGPTGWTQAKAVYASGAGSTQIWYDANNAGGVTSAKFTFSASTNATAQLAEWSGVALATPLDATASGTSSVSAASLTVSGSATAANELGLTAFAAGTGTSGNTFTPASGWTDVLSAASASRTGDYSIGVGSGTVSEKESATTSSTWSGVLATFYGSCGGGSLSLNAPSTASFPGVTLNGQTQSTSVSLGLTPTDGTGSGSGWNISGTSTTFATAGGKLLPTTATAVTSAAAAATSGTCRLPSNVISYPVALPAATSPPTAVRIYDASAGTGLGASTATLTFGLTIPADTYSGAYSSTWTFTIASGP